MKKNYVVMLMLVVVMFLSPVVASAGQIKTQTVTNGEEVSFSTAATDFPQALAVTCGSNGGDALLAGIGTFFVVLIVLGAIIGAGA